MTTDDIVPSSDFEPLTKGKTWQQMKPGWNFRTGARTVAEADLIQFITWAGFNEALFMDASHAGSRGYTGRLVPGAMTYCLAEGLIVQSQVLNGTGLAFMGMELSVKKPVYVGDTIHAVVTTTDSRATSKPGRGVVATRVSVRNQRDEEVLVFTPVRLVRGDDSE
ncbi:FAS1-like dehydratase domain-containing protein [Mycobacterium sp. MUNTM1]